MPFPYRLDVYRLSIEYTADAFKADQSLDFTGMPAANGCEHASKLASLLPWSNHYFFSADSGACEAGTQQQASDTAPVSLQTHFSSMISQQQVSLTLPVCGQYIGPSQDAFEALAQQLFGAESDTVGVRSLVRELEAVATWKPTSNSKARPQRLKTTLLFIIVFSLFDFKNNRKPKAFPERIRSAKRISEYGLKRWHHAC